MSSSDPYSALSREDLVQLILAQQRQIAELRAELEQLRRAGKRQAAPFAKDKRTAMPKRPGRKRGQGLFCYRAVPEPAEVTEPLVEVPVTQTRCSACGGTLVEDGIEYAYRTELPTPVQPQVTQYGIEVCRCVACGRRVRGEHPDVAPDQYGASAHRLGEQALATAHTLHYGVGVPVRKVPAVLQLLTGIRVTQSALTHDAQQRAAGSVGHVYRQLRTRVPAASAVHTDDTGWRVGGQPAQLMVFETATETVYQVRARHRNEEVREVVPAEYAGVLVTDRGRSYDAIELAGVRQQKCLAHIQRSISDVLEQQHGKARAFGQRLKALLRQALDLWQAYHEGRAPGFATKAQALQAAITHHLRDRPLRNPANQRLLNELGGHQDRGNLLRFLDDPAIEPTNNRAERALRPAVIARKVSQCSKTPRGADTFAAFTSVLRTLAKTTTGAVVDGLVHVFRFAQLPDALPESCE
jgi:transposase